ncbi:hypothetical protein BGW36DRAFT_356993 [Talaromyces proteolyticus]|uniref:Zn(2)-C6 fungal-type domain-containing protein n=1 Tax=Talaromyces proteolyticus TaxID=1131652 RepID=A0AAD4KUN3_9EURO|nr:uncharacterized protein BGW36DRAFT_356993 [Talaromyces proteolyticus]KAH8700329.1 hypothetical protein BGW36DRAFT_356993 [Talaromyces proteolyticus]
MPGYRLRSSDKSVQNQTPAQKDPDVVMSEDIINRFFDDKASDENDGDYEEENEEYDDQEDAECESDEIFVINTAVAVGKIQEAAGGNIGAANRPANAGSSNSDDSTDPISIEALRSWFQDETERLQKKIKTKQDGVKKVEHKIANDMERCIEKQRELQKEYEKHNKGDYELEKIKEAAEIWGNRAAKNKEKKEKVENEIAELKAQQNEILANPRNMFIKKKRAKTTKRGPRAPRYQPPPDFDPLNGDDSLSENEEYKKSKKDEGSRTNAMIACRRCRHKKTRCDQADIQCGYCKSQGKKCRYNAIWVPGRQLTSNYLSGLEKKVEAQAAELKHYEEASPFLVSTANPLSGITGYGPRPADEAFQNYYRLIHGMKPKAHVPPVLSVLAKTPSPDNEAGQARQEQDRDFGGNYPSKRRKTATSTNENTKGYSPNQSSGNSQQPSSNLTTNTVLPQPLPGQVYKGVNQFQTLWADALAGNGFSLPLKNDQILQWPTWTHDS